MDGGAEPPVDGGAEPPVEGELVATGATEVARVVGAPLAPGAKMPPGGLTPPLPEPAPPLPEPVPGLGAVVGWPLLAVVVGWVGVVPEPGLEPPLDGVLGVDGTVLPPPEPLPDPQPEPCISLVG